jgi:transcriptional regulator with XRE-family HTH domain
MKSLADWMTEQSLTIPQLVEASGVEKRIVDAIAQGRYTPSPEQRRRLAAALNVSDDITQVSHVQGHGPQFGRSP